MIPRLTDDELRFTMSTYAECTVSHRAIAELLELRAADASPFAVGDKVMVEGMLHPFSIVGERFYRITSLDGKFSTFRAAADLTPAPNPTAVEVFIERLRPLLLSDLGRENIINIFRSVHPDPDAPIDVVPR